MSMNFIFFMPDELRAESVGCYGHPIAPTPNIDALAAEGTQFNQCHVQHTVCSPSRCSMMTGWYPHVRGHRTLWHLLRPDEPHLFRYLKQAGYQIHWYGKNDLLAAESFSGVVDVATQHGKGLFGRNPYSLDDPHYYSFLYEPFLSPIEEHGDYANVQAAIDFLKSDPQEPFFIYLPLTFPHCPYCAPPHWHDFVDPDALQPLRPAELPDRPEFHQRIRESRRLNEVDEAHLRKINTVYLGMTGFIDELLGQLLSTLQDSGLADNTTVIFSSDHGDYAGDYGLVEKWPSAAEDVITRVPLIIRTPGGASGHVVDEPVELFDIMATVMELAEIEPPHTHFAQSLVPQINGAPGDPERAVFCEGGYALHEPHCFEGRPHRDQFARDETHIYYPKGKVQQDYPESVSRTVMIRTATHKLIHRPTGVSELYDLEDDPLELINAFDDPDYADIAENLKSQLLAWYIQTSDVTPFDTDPRGLPPAAISG